MWFCSWATGQGCNLIPLCLASKVGSTFLSFFSLCRKHQILCTRKKTKQFLSSFIFTQHLFWWCVQLLLKDGMIILNTVIAWLVNYCTHYFPCIFWIIAMLSFFFPSKTMETFSVFCLEESAESSLLAFSPCPSRQPSFVLAIIEIPLI